MAGAVRSGRCTSLLYKLGVARQPGSFTALEAGRSLMPVAASAMGSLSTLLPPPPKFTSPFSFEFSLKKVRFLAFEMCTSWLGP